MSLPDPANTPRPLLLVNLKRDLLTFLRRRLSSQALRMLERVPDEHDVEASRMVVLELAESKDAASDQLRTLESLVAGAPVLCLCGSETEALSALRKGCFEALVRPYDRGDVLRAIREGIDGHTWLRRIRRLDRRNRRLRRQNRRLSREVEALLRVGERARFQDARQALEDVLTGILEEIKHVLELDRILLAVVNTSRAAAELKLALGVEGLAAGDTCASTSTEDPVWRRFHRNKTPTILGPRRLDGLPAKVASVFSSGLVAAPLLAKGEIVGTLMGSRMSTPWSRRDLRLLRVFAEHAASTIENGHLYYDVIRSEEQLKETQSQLIEAERLAVIGQMTVSIRHEINNPLCNISLITQTVHRDLEESRPELAGMLDDVMTNVRRIQEVTNKLSKLKSVPLTEYLPNQLMVDLR